MERCYRELFSIGGRQLFVVFDRNFLSVDLGALISRNVYALESDEISSATNLDDTLYQISDDLNDRQLYLLERSLNYALFVSKRHVESRNYDIAIRWARIALRHSVGFTDAYLWLFKVLRDAGELDAAAELGEKIRQYRPDDPQFLRGMEDLTRKLGNLSEAAEWRRLLSEETTTPRNFAEILAKQRARNPSALPIPGPSPAVETPAPERGIGRLFKAFRRH